MINADYTTVTEITGYKVTREQMQRMYTRYRFASEFCNDREVLDVACGSGQGLGYLAKVAKRVVGGDYDDKILHIAAKHYLGRVEVKKMDAQALPFQNESFDVVIFYEALYYLEFPEKFVSEAYRVLRHNGTLIICTVNKDWSDFNPSPYSYRYFSVPELYRLIQDNGFRKQTFYGDCVVKAGTIKDRIFSMIRQTAIRFNLMPKTMKGKEFLKRIFIGKLLPLPAEIEDEIARYLPPSRIRADSANHNFKVIFVVASKD